MAPGITDISIVFATCKRLETLQPMLNGMLSLNIANISWEILVVDNANDSATRTLVESYSAKLPIHYHVEARPGKNYALNSVLDSVTAELVVFTDDDILPDEDWLQSLISGVARWPECNVFGGRILPSQPDASAKIDYKDNYFMRCAYVIADWNLPEGYYPDVEANSSVWGPNMVIRRKVFDKGVRFNTSIGPSGKEYIMGSETELTGRLFKAGMKAVYLPNALVYHQIRPEQLEYKWLCNRYYRFGRGAAYKSRDFDTAYWLGVPRYLYRGIVRRWFGLLFALPSPDVYRDRYLDYRFMRGQIDQYRVQYRNQS